MRTWESLAQEAESLRRQVYHWPSAFPERIRAALESFDRLCITLLETLLLSPVNDHHKSVKIRRLFSMRWTVVANTSLDYTLNPGLSSNAWYLAVATRLASDDEAIISILMPTIKKVIGTGMEDDIQSSTELPGRIIQLRNFILNANKDCLISIDDVFEYAKQDTHYLFPSIQASADDDEPSTETQNQNKMLFPLNASDRELLRRITPETRLFFDLLKQVHTVRLKQKPSVGFALFELHEALLRSSKIDTGSDVAANMSECQQPILDFYKVWKSLSDTDKNRISGYCVRRGGVTLRSFLLTLFSYTPGIELSPADYEAVDPDIVPCTHMIGQQLKTLLALNLDLQNMPLPGRELDFNLDIVPEDDELNEAKEKCIQSLSQRQLMAGESDFQIISFAPFFVAFTDNLLENAAVCQQILDVKSEIKNLTHLKYALLLLPEEKWHHLLLLVRDNIDAYFVDVEPEVLQSESIAFISQILKSISSRSWVSFFEALSAAKYDFLLGGDSLARLLYEFNESRWQEIVRTMGQYPALVLTSSKEIAYLLASTGIDHYRIIADLFHSAIVSTLNTPQDYAGLFEHTSREHWPQIFALFSRTLIYFIQNKLFIDEALERLQPERRMSFISLLTTSGVNRTGIIKNLHHILPHIDTVEWQAVFRMVQINSVEFPSTHIEFLLMLIKLDVASWRYLFIHFDGAISALLGDAETLGFILKNLPVSKWQPFFAHFFSHRREITSELFVSSLAEVEEKNRLRLSELMLMPRPGFLLPSGYFADALNLISPDSWGVFAGLFSQNALRTTFGTILNIQQLLKKIPIEKWGSIKSVFSSYFNIALHDEILLIMVAKELTVDKVPAFFELTSNLVKRYITDLGYLRTVFFHVRDPELSLSIVLSAAKQAGRFQINPNELIGISAYAVAMQSTRNISAVFSIFGKSEIIRYINNHFLCSPDHDPSQVASWRLLYANSCSRVNDFVKLPASFAMIFYLVPVGDWSVLVELFSDLLKSKMRDIIFLQYFLLFLPSENRLALCSALIDCFSEYDYSFGSLHYVFSTLPERDWRAFLQLIKTKNPTIKIENLNELSLMVHCYHVSNFKMWYSLLDEQINSLIEQPADMAKLFCMFSEEVWPVVMETCQFRLIERLQKVDFLKNTLHSLNPPQRFLFLKAISPYFERIPVNTTIIINVFSAIALNHWEDVAKLFKKEILSCVIANESDLSFILHGLPDNQVNFLRIIKNYLPIIRCDNPEHLMRLLVSFENCEALLLGLFENKMPELLARLIANFMIQDNWRLAITPNQKSLFNFLVAKSLPVLLSVSHFKAVFDCQNDDDLALVEEIYTEFRQIESRAELADSKDVLSKKLEVVDRFIRDVEKDSVREKSEPETMRFVVRERLSLKLIAHFGPHFFHQISQYAACLQVPLVPPGIRPNRVALFHQRAAIPPIAPVTTRLYPMTHLPAPNAGAATQQGTFLENLFLTSPRP